MDWIHAHHRVIGILADTLTFVGGWILARDALLRLRELKNRRVDVDFDSTFDGLNLDDYEWKAAVAGLCWTFWGLGLIVAGFFFQLILRLCEP